MAKKANPLTGRWRIVSMSAWDEDYIDEEEQGFFEFEQKEGKLTSVTKKVGKSPPKSAGHLST